MLTMVMSSIAHSAGMAMVAILCIIGVLLSTVSISGSWLITIAACLASILREDPFPGLATIAVFLLLSLIVEAMEALSGYWGVKRRGGSRLAGMVALVGSIVGFVAGSLIPIPIVGPLIGMLCCSFVGVFAVEYWRLRSVEHARSIAEGSVFARVFIIVIKVAMTLGMSFALMVGMLAS